MEDRRAAFAAASARLEAFLARAVVEFGQGVGSRPMPSRRIDTGAQSQSALPASTVDRAAA
jgi:hypothetical protein